MKLVCASEEWLGKYQDLCFQRGLGFKPWPSRLALLAVEGRELIAGAMVYDSSGPFLFFEHLVTNETAPARWRWAAVSMMAAEITNMCRILGKVPQVSVRHRGIKRILERAGLATQGAIVMTCGFEQLEKHDEETHHSSEHPRGLKDSAPTERAPAGDPEDHLGIYAEVSRGRGVEAGGGVI